MSKSPAARWNRVPMERSIMPTPEKYRAAWVAAIRERVADMLYAVIRPRLLAAVKAMRERQPAYWHREKWWIR